jgi:hypothetical protein
MKIRLHSTVLTAGVLLISPLVPAAVGQAASQAPAIRQIPGLTSKDAYPNGCVDCHVVGKDADMRISTLMATWTKAVPAALTEKALGRLGRRVEDQGQASGDVKREGERPADLPRGMS